MSEVSTPSGPEEPERNKQLTREFIAALSRGDIASFIGAYAEDGHLITMGNTLISGSFTRSQIDAAAQQVLEVFPEGLRFTIHGMTAEHDRVAVEAESSGRHVSGQLYNNHYHFLFRWRRGRLVELKEYMDTEHTTEVLCGGQRRM
jgi:ketosteroid isomerase-like protein